MRTLAATLTRPVSQLTQFKKLEIQKLRLDDN
jgi:hypothetical protein